MCKIEGLCWVQQPDKVMLSGQTQASWDDGIQPTQTAKFGSTCKQVKARTAANERSLQYGLFFASAGHASLIDYPEALQLQRLASKVYSDGGIVSAV